MFGNGLANIAAAIIIAIAIIWSSGATRTSAQSPERDYAEWYARAVGDIQNDIVVNCGCCGEEKVQRRAGRAPF
ncbi:MAG: hypothetical protein AAF668_04870 [Pseudomonadota bacterium]